MTSLLVSTVVWCPGFHRRDPSSFDVELEGETPLQYAASSHASGRLLTHPKPHAIFTE